MMRVLLVVLLVSSRTFAMDAAGTLRTGRVVVAGFCEAARQAEAGAGATRDVGPTTSGTGNVLYERLNELRTLSVSAKSFPSPAVRARFYKEQEARSLQFWRLLKAQVPPALLAEVGDLLSMEQSQWDQDALRREKVPCLAGANALEVLLESRRGFQLEKQSKTAAEPTRGSQQ